MTNAERAAYNRASAAKIQTALDALAALAAVQLTSGTDRSIAAVVSVLTWERDSFLGAAESLAVAGAL